MKRQRIFMMSFLFLSIIGAFFYRFKLEQRLDQVNKAQIQFEKRLQTIDFYKKRYENESYIKKAILSVAALYPPTSKKVSKDYIVLTFEKLTNTMLNRLLNKIANSYLIILELKVTRGKDRCNMSVKIRK